MLNWSVGLAFLCLPAAGIWANPLFSADQDFQLIDSDSGKPVQGAILRLTQASGSRDWELEADDDGRASISGVKAGKYRLQIEKAGFVDPADIEGKGRWVEVTEARQSRLLVGLERSVVIAGQVRTEDGHPLSGIGVFAAKIVKADSGTHLRRIGMLAFSDDQGRYRLHHLPAGSYLIVASPMGDIASASGLGVAYYPGYGDVARAETLELAPGTDLQTADIRMQPGGLGEITGTVTGIPQDWAGSKAAVALIPQSGMRLPVAFGMTDSSGHYKLERVPEGDYQLLAWGPWANVGYDEPPQGSPARYGSGTVSVRGGDRPTFDLALTPGVRVEVRRPSAKSCAVDGSLQMRLESGWPESWAFEAARSRDGVAWNNVPPATYRFDMHDLERYCYFAGVHSAQDGPPELKVSIESPVVLSAVTVASSGEISGKVQVDGVPSPGAIIVLTMEKDRALSVETRADDSGQFRIERLPPGAFRIMALPKVSPKVDSATGAYRPVQQRIVLEPQGRLAVELNLRQGN